jgi:hypothetical protein
MQLDGLPPLPQRTIPLMMRGSRPAEGLFWLIVIGAPLTALTKVDVLASTATLLAADALKADASQL